MRVLAFLFAALNAVVAFPQSIEGVTFASEPSAIYVPVRDAAKRLGWKVEYDDAVELIKLNGSVLSPRRPQLPDGAWLVSLSELAKLGAKVQARSAKSASGAFSVTIGPKKVSVDLKSQLLQAWQGTRLVFRSSVSTGREGKETPNGRFTAGEKEPMHISKLYGSPMPFSVHLAGNIYVHGSDRFSMGPGSHGCIRLPMIEERNVAQEFYNWIDIGTPVTVSSAYAFAKNRTP